MSDAFHFLDDVATVDLAFDVSGHSLQELFPRGNNAQSSKPLLILQQWGPPGSKRLDDQLKILPPAELLFDWLSDEVCWKDAAGGSIQSVGIHR